MKVTIKYEETIDDCSNCPFHYDTDCRINEESYSHCSKIGRIEDHNPIRYCDWDTKLPIPNDCPFNIESDTNNLVCKNNEQHIVDYYKDTNQKICRVCGTQ